MPRPLLTDEIIDRYNRGEDLEQILRDYEARTGLTVSISEVDIDRMVKSRRIEKAKRGLVQRKLNRLLFLILLLLALLFYAVFNI